MRTKNIPKSVIYVLIGLVVVAGVLLFFVWEPDDEQKFTDKEVQEPIQVDEDLEKIDENEENVDTFNEQDDTVERKADLINDDVASQANLEVALEDNIILARAYILDHGYDGDTCVYTLKNSDEIIEEITRESVANFSRTECGQVQFSVAELNLGNYTVIFEYKSDSHGNFSAERGVVYE